MCQSYATTATWSEFRRDVSHCRDLWVYQHLVGVVHPKTFHHRTNQLLFLTLTCCLSPPLPRVCLSFSALFFSTVTGMCAGRVEKRDKSSGKRQLSAPLTCLQHFLLNTSPSGSKITMITALSICPPSLIQTANVHRSVPAHD